MILPEAPSLVEILEYNAASQHQRQVSTSVFITSHYVLNSLTPYLQFYGKHHGVEINLSFGLFNAGVQEVLDPKSALRTASPRFILVSHDLSLEIPWYRYQNWNSDQVTSSFLLYLESLLQYTDAHLFVANFVEPLTGRFGESGQGQCRDQVVALNQALAHFVQHNSERITGIDFNQLIQSVGYQQAWDNRLWFQSRSPFRPKFFCELSRLLVSEIAVRCGLLRKCLVLDADDTLWGGVVGEEGISGIKLDPFDYPGRVFYEVQLEIKSLYSKGVILALASKNNLRDVKEVFDAHPHMVLSWEDFICHEVHWEPKSTSVERISQKLNLGLGSFVFLDDSDYECGLIHSTYPEIWVLPRPRNLSDYPGLLMRSYAFPIDLNSDGTNKTQQYRADLQRQESRSIQTDLNSYLESLKLEARVHLMREDEIERVSQLTQKTNQFNLTVERLTPADIRRLHNDPNYRIFVLWGKDRFGETGLTNVLIARLVDTTVVVEVFLMSCRVFERGFEYALLSQAVLSLKADGAQTLESYYRRAAKNKIVESFWTQVGVAVTAEEEELIAYRGSIDALTIPSTSHIKIEVE